MNEDLLISIIIPYYKTLDLTKKLLDVLIPQLTNEVELIIVDDGCNETELDHLLDITKMVKVIHQENGGVSKARNTGLDIVKGKYIVFVDSDDLVPDYYIEKIVDKINTEEFDYCYMSWKYKNGIEITIVDNPPVFNQSVWNCIYRSDLIGGERFNEKMNFAEDQDFNNRVRKGKKENILEVMYYYNNENENSLTRQYFRSVCK